MRSGWRCLPRRPTIFADDAAAALVVMVAVAIALLGPGAYSLDSYLFGRREIVIAAAGVPGTLNRDTPGTVNRDSPRGQSSRDCLAEGGRFCVQSVVIDHFLDRR